MFPPEVYVAVILIITSSQAPSYARRVQSETIAHSLTYSLTGVKCRATSVAKNSRVQCAGWFHGEKLPAGGQQSLTQCPQRQKEQKSFDSKSFLGIDFWQNQIFALKMQYFYDMLFTVPPMLEIWFTVPPSSLVLTSTSSATDDLISLTCVATDAFPAPILSLAWTER